MPRGWRLYWSLDVGHRFLEGVRRVASKFRCPEIWGLVGDIPGSQAQGVAGRGRSGRRAAGQKRPVKFLLGGIALQNPIFAQPIRQSRNPR